MAIYLLDTNIIIDAINGKRNRSQWLLELVEHHGHTLACCPINIAEVYAGMRPNEAQRTRVLLQSLQLFPITCDVAEMAGLLKRDHARKGITISLSDALIAAVALDNQLTLVTENVGDFPMAGLSVYPLPRVH